MTTVTYIRHLQQTSHRIVDAPLKNKEEHTLCDSKYDVIITSPYLRSRQTAKLYEQSRTTSNYKELVVDVNLCEYHGHKALMKFNLDGVTSSFGNIPDSSETWEQCAQRLDTHIETILNLKGNVLVVAHGIVVNYVEEKLLGKSSYKRGKDVPYGGGFTVRIN